MDIRALQLASRFSLPPNSLGYCGNNKAPAKLIGCVIDGNCREVIPELEKFIVLNPYLNTLAEITGKDKHSYPVVEAYCLGNNQLKKAKNNHYGLLLKNFTRQGKLHMLVSELRKSVPSKFIPFHLFQVLHIGVGRASKSVPFNIHTVNNCMVRWGKVLGIKKRVLNIELISLEKNRKKYQLTKTKEEIPYRSDFLPDLKIGDTVAVHWRQVIKILNSRETVNLDYWTRQTLSSI
jgi:hypothetical protein